MIGLPFVDADAEVEAAAGMPVPDIFARLGEPAFRAGEARVMARLLQGGSRVHASRGGAVMDKGTRAAIRRSGISVWLKVDVEVLAARVARRDGGRPLAGRLRELIPAREPFYALSDLTVACRDIPCGETAREVVEALSAHLAGLPGTGGGEC